MGGQDDGDGQLIIKNDGIGDLIIASGVIAEIARVTPGPVDLLTCRENAEIAGLIPGVREVLTCSRQSLRIAEGPGGYVPVVEDVDRALIERLQTTRYKRIIVLRRFMAESTLVLMSAITADEKICMWQMPTNVSVGAARYFSQGWAHLKADEKIRSEIDYYGTVVSHLLRQTIDAAPRLALPDGAAPFASDGSIALGVGGSSSRWPGWYWIAVCRALRRLGYTQIRLFGGPSRAARVVAKLVPGIEDLTGKLPFLDSLPYLRRASLVISNDTGFAHLAALAARKVLVIQGGGTFGRFFPWPGATNQHILYRGMTCFDCDWQCMFHNPFQRQACLKRISPREVVRFAQDILEGRAPMARNLGLDDGSYELAWRRRDGPDVPMPLSAQALTAEREKGRLKSS